MAIVDGLEAALHRPNRFDVRVPHPSRSSVPLDPLLRRADQPSQSDLARHGRSSHGDQELTAVQLAPPQFDQHLHGAVEVISPVQAEFGFL
jgi:hypothetical protein